MLDKMTSNLGFHGNALILRAERQRTIASNIANADTPGYVARDFNFADALREATAPRSVDAAAPGPQAQVPSPANGRHMPLQPASGGASMSTVEKLGYSVQTQPALDNNSVDLNRERSNFVDNAVRYEAALRFINGTSKTMLSAIQGQ